LPANHSHGARVVRRLTGRRAVKGISGALPLADLSPRTPSAACPNRHDDAGSRLV